jgi:ATP-binding cassette subfamily B protein
MSTLASAGWPPESMGRALGYVARTVVQQTEPEVAAMVAEELAACAPTDMDAAVEWGCARLGLEAEPVSIAVEELATFFQSGPSLLRTGPSPDSGFLVIVGARRGRVLLAAPDGHTQRVPLRQLCAAISDAHATRLKAELGALLDAAGLQDRARQRAERTLLAERLTGVRVGGGWLLRRAPSAPIRDQLAELGLPRRLSALALAYLAQYGAWLASWAVLGHMIFGAQFDLSWLAAWLLAASVMSWLSTITMGMAGQLAIEVGAQLKRRMLYGVLQLPLDGARKLGIGDVMSRLLEAEVLEAGAVDGGLIALLAALELGVAAFLLAMGAGGLVQLVTFVVFVAAMGLGLRAKLKQQRRWTEERRRVTSELLEGMVAYRTRLAQQPERRWHQREDDLLRDYLASSGALDRVNTAMQVWLPRSWLLVGLATLAPAVVTGTTSATLAAAIGVLLLVFQASRRFLRGSDQVIAARVAYDQLKDIFAAAAQATEPPTRFRICQGLRSASAQATAVIEARRLCYQNRSGSFVLDGLDLTIGAEDQILLQGASGSGKSIFASVLAGLRLPQTGTLMLAGLDHHTLRPDGWRQLVAAAPQFHENHIFSGPLAFNLLMGREWPPTRADLREAETLCRELGLGPLLDRMPAGIYEQVGDHGWQLSHGERGRVYLARALLQGAWLQVLDESFAALDPENLGQALECVMSRARPLVVIAHP